MELRPGQLAEHLERGLAPVYVVGGEEPLQVEECLDAIRRAAARAGWTERSVLEAETGFDWGRLEASRDTLSLFAERRLLELRLPSGKPGEAGARALVAYTEQLAGRGAGDDTLLLVNAGPVDGRTRRARWYRALERAGAAIHAWPVDPGRLPGWIEHRARSRGVRITQAAAVELALRVEGNLLAGAQELELLGLLSGGEPIDVELILSVAADRARYDAFDLVDATLQGDPARTVRILRGLEREGAAVTAVLGTLAWEIRSLCGFATRLAAGEPVDRVLSGNPVWSRRRALVRRALERHRRGARYEAEPWAAMIAELRTIDGMAKGVTPGDAWEALLALTVRMAGLALLPSPAP